MRVPLKVDVMSLVDRDAILDRWIEGRRGTLVTIYGLRHPLTDRAFYAEATTDDALVARKLFVLDGSEVKAMEVELAGPELRPHMKGQRRRTKSVVVGAVLFALVALASGCGEESDSSPGSQPAQDVAAESCDAEPRELPSGSDPGTASSEDGAYGELSVWGKGEDRVALLDEIPPDLGVPAPSEVGESQQVSVRGHDGVVFPVGDPPGGEVIVSWSEGDCAYTVWVGPGLDLDDVTDYAGRF